MSNLDLKVEAKKRGVFQWEIAEALGVAETSLSRRMRHELPTDEKEKILGIINNLAKRKAGEQSG